MSQIFNPNRLSLARKRNRLTKKSLASLVGLTPDSITRLENGTQSPQDETLKKLSKILKYSEEFFYKDDPDLITAENVNFRSLSTMIARDRDAFLAVGSLSFDIIDWIDSKFVLPKLNVPDLSVGYTPDTAAAVLRNQWGVGQQPISDLIKLIESKGVRVFSLNESIETADAFSLWRDGVPYIFLNGNKTAERTRFDISHELGHIVLHRGGRVKESPIKIIEKEADTFASCFLMPECDVRSNVNGFITIDRLLKLKLRWKISLSALSYRVHKLGIISDWQYRNFCIEIRKRYGKTEPASIKSNGSSLWRMIFSELWKDKISINHIAKELALPENEIVDLTKFESLDIVGNNPHNKNKLTLVN